ncbi:MAG TPA: universal stress protein [Acidimicrobiales bacterium]
MSSSSRSAADATPLAAVPVEVSHLVVPLDGSPFAEHALPVAAWLAEGLGADLHLAEVVPQARGAEDAIRYLDAVGRRQHAAWELLEGADVAGALAAALGTAGRVTCMATHGRDRAAGLLGSVAAAVLHRTARPAVLVGPQARAVTASDAPVVAAVDGTGRDERLVRLALGWATRLGRRLDIVTVAEPTAADGRKETAPPRRRWGPPDPEAYVASLAARVEAPGVVVTSRAVFDPAGVRDGLLPVLDRTAALVVLGCRQPAAGTTMVLGGHAARLVHDARVPALTVPPPTGQR